MQYHCAQPPTLGQLERAANEHPVVQDHVRASRNRLNVLYEQPHVANPQLGFDWGPTLRGEEEKCCRRSRSWRPRSARSLW
jgi:hypothetical protein